MRVRDQRGVVFPSPVVILSVIAVAMAGVAWIATRGHEPTEQLVTPTSQHSPSAHHSTYHKPKSHQSKHTTPAVDRGKVIVQVFNNSHVTGLAGRVSSRVSQAGWQVVGSDNWYGTIPASTVYYPPKLKAAGKLLALDLGIHRTMPAVGAMRLDRLTVILTAELPATTG
jgi:hypothetical protein